MKDFLKGYKEAHAKAREYMRAERAGWVKPGKRTTENHAILIPRREAVEMAEELATNIYAREFYIDWAMELRGFMETIGQRSGRHPGVWKMWGRFPQRMGRELPVLQGKGKRGKVCERN